MSLVLLRYSEVPREPKQKVVILFTDDSYNGLQKKILKPKEYAYM